MDTIEALAAEALRHFILGTRDSGAQFWKIGDEAPAWLAGEPSDRSTSLIWAAHDNGDVMPDDYRYAYTRDALTAIAEGDTDGDAIEADIYTADRLRWLASGAGRLALCDEAIEDYGPPTPDTLEERIGMGQLLEKRRVFDAVRAFLEELAGEGEDEDDSAEG